jgi:hypothetical protein
VYVLHYLQRKTVPEKALTISGAGRFTRRGGTCRLDAIFMNQLSVIWGYQEELSSTAVCPRAEGVYSVNDQGRMRALPFAMFVIGGVNENGTKMKRKSSVSGC